MFGRGDKVLALAEILDFGGAVHARDVVPTTVFVDCRVIGGEGEAAWIDGEVFRASGVHRGIAAVVLREWCEGDVGVVLLSRLGCD